MFDTLHRLKYPQPFEEKPLDSPIDFSDVPQNRVAIIVGKSQTVYWQWCNVTVYELDEEGKEQTRRLYGMLNGQGVTPLGVKLYVTKGKFIE